MKILYFDCYSGISGDMILGALNALGVDSRWLSGQLQSLPLEGVSLEPQTVSRGALTGTLMKVCIPDPDRHPRQPVHQPDQPHQPDQHDQSNQPDQSHPPHHPRRTLADFVNLLQQSTLSEDIRSSAIRVFTAIAQAEARIHGKDIEEIHFHELGYLDSVVDIVGALLSIKALGIEKIFSSPLHLGSGFTSTEHGTIPVPAPATLELLAGIPVYSTGISHELVTPTGAGLISTLAAGFGPMPSFSIEKTGYGAGTRELTQIPNFLRVVMGTMDTAQAIDTMETIRTLGTPAAMEAQAATRTPFSDWRMERISTLETDIDDMNPEYYDHIIARLFAAGALDVTLIPVIMKKNRPATRLSVLTSPALSDELCSIIVQETSTLGIRIKEGWRKVIDREIIQVHSPFGPIRVKIGKVNGKMVTASPEYEDCRHIALKVNRPLKEIYQEALKSIPYSF
ncbi:MAG: nickel pincer cofactor biosynthesis protein LarC [bacterium]